VCLKLHRNTVKDDKYWLLKDLHYQRQKVGREKAMVFLTED